MRRTCRAVALAAVVALTLYLSFARPHIGLGPSLAFVSVHAPETAGPSERLDWLSQVAEVLIEDGYHPSVLQVSSPGQVFGLVKSAGGLWEYHIRGFVDGRLQGEIEISRDYLQHLSNAYRADAASYVVSLLDSAGIRWTTDEPIVDMVVPALPEHTISWKHLVLLSPVFQALISLDGAVRPL
jgi:hypothetical protein